MDDNDIRSQEYSSIFGKQNSIQRGFYNTIVLILIFSVISGFAGYYLGASGYFKTLSNLLNNSSGNTEAKVYTEEELASKIDASKYDMNLYQQVIANLKDKYVDPSKVDDEKLFDGSLKGLVNSVDDKATVYMNKDDYAQFQQGFTGSFEGIGVRLEYQNGRIMVSDVIENSPAEAANVKAGYVFMEVDGKNVEEDTLDDLVSKVKGASGTKVKIKFFDPLKNDFVEMQITRGPISVDSMRIIEKDNETVVLEISRFTESTPEQWKSKWDDTVAKIQAKNYKNIIIDLRGNPGGYLDAAIYAANDFLDPNQLILTERTRSEGDNQVRSTKASPRLKDKKVILLVNGGTASASEILAGTLSFNKKYKVIGTKSYGKGTVQMTYKLYNGGALKITTEYWLLPTGKRLDNENPITPDKVVVQDPAKYREGIDTQMDEALKAIKE